MYVSKPVEKSLPGSGRGELSPIWRTQRTSGPVGPWAGSNATMPPLPVFGLDACNQGHVLPQGGRDNPEQTEVAGYRTDRSELSELTNY